MMFSSQACSALHSHHKLSPCRWSASGASLTGERGSTMLGKNIVFNIVNDMIEEFRYTIT
jgi:hypothetical protein